MEKFSLMGQFQLSAWFDLGATFLFALTGALSAKKKGYDVVGVLALAFATGAGGGLIRDSIFLRNSPPVVIADSRYLIVIAFAAGIGFFIGERLNRLQSLFMMFDALGLGAYAVVGVQKSVNQGLLIVPAILVGVVNAVGGGLLRDILAREEPLLFKPSEFYAIAAFLGCSVFLALAVTFKLRAHDAAFISILVTFLFRMLSLRFGWKSA
ncbi:MAG TPA: TRIC cation channel family protein [Acidobacteriota bacterium]|nr:TRIC cation channel family protein [Acidobacteriota bacterium]